MGWCQAPKSPARRTWGFQLCARECGSPNVAKSPALRPASAVVVCTSCAASLSVVSRSAGRGLGTQVGVHGLPADAELPGQRRLPLPARGAVAQLSRALGVEGGFPASLDARGFGRGGALALAVQDESGSGFWQC